MASSRRLAITALVLLATVSLTAGCAPLKESPAPKTPRARYAPIYDESVCAISKDQGDVASGAKLTESDPVISDFFDKHYDRALLDGVLGASAASTGRYVSQALGGRLFRVPRDAAPGQVVCPNFIDLPAASDEMRATWWDPNSTFDDPKWSLAGLYFQDCGGEGRTPCDDHGMIQPTILIDEARDRWTLVHEMMHFNFDRERRRDPGSVTPTAPIDPTVAKEAARAAYTRYQAKHEVADLTEMQKRSSMLIRTWFYPQMIKTLLEEIAVEGLLVDEFAAGRLKNVAGEAAANALSYMEASRAKFAQEYASDFMRSTATPAFSMSLESFNRLIFTEATSRALTDIIEQAAADAKFVADALARADELIATRKRRLQRSNGFRLRSYLAAPPVSLAVEIDSHLASIPDWRRFQDWKDR